MTDAVLIVDDSLTVRMDLADAFAAAGFRTVPCSTIAEARQALASEPVSLVVLDVLLPDGDGVDLLRELRAAPATAATPVLMLSSEAEVKDRIRGLRTGADEYVGKPYDTKYVVAKARELVGAGGKADDGRATVLVVDDSPTFRQALIEALEGAGYAVLAASSGEEGIGMIAERRPNAIIVDGVMPGMDGATLIRRIRLDAALRAIPCLLLTASEDSGAELRALEAGADAFVRKDEDLDIILARLAAAMRGGASHPGGQMVSLIGPRKILAVDDSQTYLQELAAALRGEGYDVALARSGEEALELLAVQSVDCILLDLMMPGMGGKEACRRIKAAPMVRDIPLIMLTALDDRAAMLEGLGAGADDYIPKSSEFEVLKARVRAQIRRKQFEDENRRIREELLRREMEAAEARGARELAETRAALVEELERKNRELEAFSYSVSHDLRAPLRSIDGFSQAVLEDCGDQLDETGRSYLARVRAAAQRMGQLIDDMITLSRVNRSEMNRGRVDLSAMAREVIEENQRRDPERTVDLSIEEGLVVDADGRLIRIVLENLLGNAWKFSGKVEKPRIEVGAIDYGAGVAYFVRDNGAGFDMSVAAKLFTPFQRFHTASEFPGTGIGLATVYRVVDRHGGRVWAEAERDKGATFFFTLERAAVLREQAVA